ncbi:hypothetical protein HMSSN139_42070 [Paenibacillus sp. HMSSN-139]|nr:hypothetical protein HMSSN139_42070 [Paenibacillus sp. HMSSN-139]
MRYAKPSENVGLGKARNSVRLRKRILRWGLAFILLGVGWVLFVLAQIGSVERNPAANATLSEPAEVGIVLGAAMWGDEPSPGLRERLEQSLKDYEAGKFKWFLLTGGWIRQLRDIPKRRGWRIIWSSTEFRGTKCSWKTRRLAPTRT